MKLGLFGGTFDPIHRGHLDVLHAAQRALALDSIWVIPSHVPPHRRAPAASAAHRFAMAAIALQQEASVLLSAVEMDAAGPSYTAATLDRLASRGVAVNSACFIIGADAFREIGSWRAFPDVLDRCHFAVVSRPGLEAAALKDALPDLAGRMRSAGADLPAQPSILLVNAPTAAVSSTSVREAVARGASIADMVAPGVEAYIARHGLYRSANEPSDRFKGVA